MGRWVDPVPEKKNFTTAVLHQLWGKMDTADECQVTGPPKDIPSWAAWLGGLIAASRPLAHPLWARKMAEGRTGRRKCQGKTRP